MTRDNVRLKIKCEAVVNPLILRSLKRRIKAQEKEIGATRKQINKTIEIMKCLLRFTGPE